MLWGCFTEGETGALHKKRWHHEERTLCGNTESISQDISQEVKASAQWVFQIDNDPKPMARLVTKWLKDNKVSVLEWP